MKRLSRLADGTAYYAPPGELVYDPVADRVQCHLCGRWLRALAPSHLWSRHGWTHDDYVEAFGLKLRRPLVTPTVSRVKSDKARRWYETDPQTRANLSRGLSLMRDQNQRAAWAAATRRQAMPLERLRSAQASIAAATAAQARTAAERRAVRLRELGFADLESFLGARYVVDKASTQEVATALLVSPAWVRAQLKRLGLGPRRPAEDANEAWRQRRREEQQRVADELGFASFQAYLEDRIGSGWRFERIAREVGHHPAWVKAGCRDKGIQPPPFDLPENSRHARALGRAKYAEQLRLRREGRLAELGFADMATYLRDRYVDKGYWTTEMKQELHVGADTIAAALIECGLSRARR